MDRIEKLKILTYSNGQFVYKEDICSIEEPLEIRLTYGAICNRKTESVAITMRTPGHDEELALGFLLNEGIIHANTELLSVKKSVAIKNIINPNIITISLTPDFHPDLIKLKRNFYTTSSCGICGKSSIDALMDACTADIPLVEGIFTIESIKAMPAIMRKYQSDFEHTGGIHASALFDEAGELIVLREDVGRHNALDKITGFMYLNKILHTAKSLMLMLSGRVSYELIQKAAMSGIHLIAAIGAPSSLAVRTAAALNITLIGFLRGENFNLYTHRERLKI